MRRTLILTALGATTLSMGLGVGAILASANSAPASSITTTSMMTTTMMASDMMTGDMNTMHATMHAAMEDRMSADLLAACDAAHATMTSSPSSSDTPMPAADHASHHQGSQP
jgi:hypothetical protein